MKTLLLAIVTLTAMSSQAFAYERWLSKTGEYKPSGYTTYKVCQYGSVSINWPKYQLCPYGIWYDKVTGTYRT